MTIEVNSPFWDMMTVWAFPLRLYSEVSHSIIYPMPIRSVSTCCLYSLTFSDVSDATHHLLFRRPESLNEGILSETNCHGLSQTAGDSLVHEHGSYRVLPNLPSSVYDSCCEDPLVSYTHGTHIILFTMTLLSEGCVLPHHIVSQCAELLYSSSIERRSLSSWILKVCPRNLP